MAVSYEDRQLTDRLEVFVAWAGRYPLPTPNQPRAVLEIRDDDFQRLNDLYGRIDRLLRVPATP